MSHVFLAEENALGRRVVIKVLPENLAGAVSAVRFRREIGIAAQLQNPHIVPLLSAGEVDHLPYYTMPYIESESLRTRITRGDLPIADVILILRDVARAMDYAHGKGVTHRDIKPDNILLSGPSAMITDFGVSKAVSGAAEAESLTTIGVALGTPAYMSPEQAAADPATDHRSDIYSFGAVGYEMLAGHPPFAGRSAQATMAAHAAEPPPPLTTARPTAPPLLAKLVMQCLEKRPGDRPQSASEIVRLLDQVAFSGGTATQAANNTRTIQSWSRMSLRWLAPAVALLGIILIGTYVRRAASDGGEIRSVAVLPFENSARDTAFAYLEDGISDHVRDALNAISGLAVKARSSSRQLRGSPLTEVRDKLAVAAVLQGTFSRVADRLHVTAELVRTTGEDVLWSGSFDGRARDVADIQDSIVHAVSGKLRVSTGNTAAPPGTAAGGARGTENIDAYDEFLHANFAAEHLNWPAAAALYREAVRIDPRFARAHAFLAMAYANEPTLGAGNVDSLNALARSSAALALTLDKTVSEAYVAQGYALANEMRFAHALLPLRSAYLIDSSNTDVLISYGFALGQVGRVTEAVQMLERARQRDPLSFNAIGVSAYMLELAKRYPESLQMASRIVAAQPTNVLPQQGMGYTYAFAGKPDSALTSFLRAFASDSTLFSGRANLVFGYALVGRWDEARRQRRLAEHEPSGNSPNVRQMIAELAFGEYEAAMSSLERAVSAHDALMGILSIPCDPLFDPLKRNPRFDRLMERIGGRACPVSGKWPIGRPQ